MRRISLPEMPKTRPQLGTSGPPLLPKSPTVTLTPPAPASLCTTPATDSLPSPPPTITNHESLERKESKRSTVSSSSGGGPSRTGGSVSGGGGNAQHDPREKRRRKIVIIIVVTAVALFVMCVLLVAVTLKLTPSIDEKIRKENEEMLRMLTQSNVNVQPEHRPDNGSTGTSTSTPRPTNNEG